MSLKKLRSNRQGSMDFILSAVALAIVLAISIVIVYNVMSSFDTATIDDDLQAALSENTTTFLPAGNATTNLLDNLGTFYTISPIILIVIAAVAILSYVLMLRKRG